MQVLPHQPHYLPAQKHLTNRSSKQGSYFPLQCLHWPLLPNTNSLMEAKDQPSKFTFGSPKPTVRPQVLQLRQCSSSLVAKLYKNHNQCESQSQTRVFYFLLQQMHWLLPNTNSLMAAKDQPSKVSSGSPKPTTRPQVLQLGKSHTLFVLTPRRIAKECIPSFSHLFVKPSMGSTPWYCQSIVMFGGER